MKVFIKNLFRLRVLIGGLGLILAGRVTAQAFTNLHNFADSDGANPSGGFVLSGSTLYGTASESGLGSGTVFRVNTNGTGFTSFYSFTVTSGPLYTNSDGAQPRGLILSGNTLYGTTANGGSSGNGTVFKVNTDGTGFTNLHSFTVVSNFTNSDGAHPQTGLILSDNTLYGTALQGGSSGYGTVFKVNTNGAGFTNLHNFTAVNDSTNSDGAYPYAGLIVSGNALYGTAGYGGSSGAGTVFAINTNGTGFTNLHSFAYGSDGAQPYTGLILSGSTLYGTASQSGLGSGTVFKVNTNGTGFTNLHSFAYGSDGAQPHAGLILSGNTLYGTAVNGGGSGAGTVFAVNTNGTCFTSLYSFTVTTGPLSTNSDGAYPYAGLVLSGNTLYGTAVYGGSSGRGTVFSLFIPPQLTIIRLGSNVVLTWPTNAVGFTLQSTMNLLPPTVWSVVFPSQVVVNGQNTVTNPISGAQKFYRLSQ